MKQIEFNKLFYAKTYVPLDYFLRSDSNGRHDEIFLNSYLHDAKLFLNTITLKTGRMAISLQRIAWELWAVSNNLPICNSKLLFFNVIDYNFWISHSLVQKLKIPAEIEINEFAVSYHPDIVSIELLSKNFLTETKKISLSISIKRNSKKYLRLYDEIKKEN